MNKPVTPRNKKPAEPQVYSDDLPAAWLRFMCRLPDDTPVSSRVDQLWNSNTRKELK